MVLAAQELHGFQDCTREAKGLGRVHREEFHGRQGLPVFGLLLNGFAAVRTASAALRRLDGNLLAAEQARLATHGIEQAILAGLDAVELEHVLANVVGAATVVLQHLAARSPSVDDAVGFIGETAADLERGTGMAQDVGVDVLNAGAATASLHDGSNTGSSHGGAEAAVAKRHKKPGAGFVAARVFLDPCFEEIGEANDGDLGLPGPGLEQRGLLGEGNPVAVSVLVDAAKRDRGEFTGAESRLDGYRETGLVAGVRRGCEEGFPLLGLEGLAGTVTLHSRLLPVRQVFEDGRLRLGLQDSLVEVLEVRGPLPLRRVSKGSRCTIFLDSPAHAMRFNDVDDVIIRGLKPGTGG